ncbi:GNAT family N-acetyltransferase [Calothrix sp. CCY 0018]|uniref:GNAT family N-acetyltransferase n=1 Tax=Calothrix sp. CCY 0018 TaxID=3103864 RepID=UPI0039C6B2D7
MQVEIINSIRQFDQLETNWNDVYACDSNAQIFLSWSWLRGWLEVVPHDWFILAVRSKPDLPYVAFFPLAIRSLEWANINVYRSLQTCAHPVADYTGFICKPEYEQDAIKNFALYIDQDLQWDIFHVKDIQDSRLNVFAKHFSESEFQIESNPGATCPYIYLPDTWEEYLQNFISRKPRKNLRNSLNKIEKNSDFYFSNIQADNLDNQIEVLFELWQIKWGKQPESTLNTYRSVFHQCAKNNSLWIDVLWDKTTPVAATGMYVDRDKKAVYGQMTGFNPEYSKLSPGRTVIAFSIKKAIENQFKFYDFLRGDLDYKISLLGAEKRWNTDCKIVRKNLRTNTIRLAQYSKKLLSLAR